MVTLKTKVAVYGSLRRDFHNHRIIEHSKFLGMTRTDPEYTMLSLGSFPAVIEGGDTSILVEIYEVDPETFASLDILEGYSPEKKSAFYSRKLVEFPEFGACWMYYIDGGAEGFSNTRVPSGDWGTHKQEVRYGIRK
jgi:gamma-glutamylcyclotransferase (GGCT)/AIG2-like uncharacterized protein YtfP